MPPGLDRLSTKIALVSGPTAASTAFRSRGSTKSQCQPNFLKLCMNCVTEPP